MSMRRVLSVNSKISTQSWVQIRELTTQTLSTLASVYSISSSSYRYTRHVISQATSTESLIAIGVGLVLRVVLDVATDNDDKVGGVLIGLWEGVVFNHFVRRMPHSFDPYIGFGFRIFVDFLFTQSLSRLALVSLWSLVGMLLADIAPNVWRDSGLRGLYRQVRKDVRHVKRSVPRIRIQNDLPSVRLFKRSRSTSTEVSGSIRSDRATPSHSPVPSPAPAPSPARRPGRSPPGTFPDVSGWSETATDVSRLSLVRERVVTNPSSPALISSREFAAEERIDTTVETQIETATVHHTTVAITHTQEETVQSGAVVEATILDAAISSTALEPSENASRHDPPTIPDDWVDIRHPTPARANIPVPPFQPDFDSAPELETAPPTLASLRPTSFLAPPPVIDVLPDIPDVDAGNRTSRSPDQIPLPESRAASVLGSTVDKPDLRKASREISRSRADKAASELGATFGQSQPRSALRESLRSGVDKAASEVGVGRATYITTQSSKTQSKGSSKASRPPDQVPLPESRAVSVLGSVVDQPEPPTAWREVPRSCTPELGGTFGQSQPCSALCENPHSGVDKAASEIGVDRATNITTQSSKVQFEGSSKGLRPPDQVPLPGSRAVSVLGSVVDQPEPPSASREVPRFRGDKATSELGGTFGQSQPRSTLRESLRSGVDKAASEIGVDHAARITTQPSQTQSTRGWADFASWGRSKLKQASDVAAPAPPPKETREEPVGESRPDAGTTVQGSEPPVSTPAQVDPHPNILTQPGDSPLLLLTTEAPKPEEGQAQSGKPELTPIFSAGVDASPGPLREMNKDEKAGPRKDSLFDVPTPTRTPPPPFTEFAGVPEGPAAGEAPAEENPLVQDEIETVLTEKQKAAEEKRQDFLKTQVSELETERAKLQKRLENDGPTDGQVKALKSDIEDAEKTLSNVKARMSKKKFSEPQSDPSMPEVSLVEKSATEVEIALTSTILNMLLTRDDAEPMTIQALTSTNRQKSLKGKAKGAKDAVLAFAKRHRFAYKSENTTPGIINITF